MNDEKPVKSIDQNKNLGQIIKYLKDQPFLLIIIAVLILITLILSFDIEKIKEIKLMVMAIVFIPLVMQFYLEIRKSKRSHEEDRGRLTKTVDNTVDKNEVNVNPVIPDQSVRYSVKTIISCILIVMVMFAYVEDELDEDTLYGILMFLIIALSLAISAWFDIKNARSVGKKLTVTNIVLSLILLISSVGWFMDSNELKTVGIGQQQLYCCNIYTGQKVCPIVLSSGEPGLPCFCTGVPGQGIMCK